MTITITTPLNNASLSSVVEWRANVTDPTVNAVQFLIDNKMYYQSYAAPWITSVPTAAWSNGDHVWMVVALDMNAPTGHNELGRTSIIVHTQNTDITAPIVTITNPLTNTMVKDTIPIYIRATDINGIALVRLFVEGVEIGSDAVPELDPAVSTLSRYIINLDTKKLTNGLHTIIAKGYDKYGNVGSRSIVVGVLNPVLADTTAPVITVYPISAPAGALPLRLDINGITNEACQVKVNGITVQENGISWGTSLWADIAGIKNIAISAKDSSNNISTVTKTWTVIEKPKEYISTVQ